MLTLTPTLHAAQRGSILTPIYKVDLYLKDYPGETITYTQTRIINPSYLIQGEFDNAVITLYNGDNLVPDLNKRRAVISCGYTTEYASETEANKYATYAPLYVVRQRYGSQPGALICTLDLIGVPNLLNMDEASEDYIPTKDDTSTITQLINGIFDPTLACYSQCGGILVEFDDVDPLMSFVLADRFRILQGETRWAKLQQLLAWTSSVAKVVYSSTVGQEAGVIHIFMPKSAAPYDYKYNRTSGNTDTTINTAEELDASETGIDCDGTITTAIPVNSIIKINDEYMRVTAQPTTTSLTVVRATNATTHLTGQDIYLLNHNYLPKRKDNTIIFPNYIDVSSSPDHEEQYSSGASSAKISGFDDLYPALKIRTYKRMRLDSDQDGIDLSTALLAQQVLNDEIGSCFLKGNMNVGQEIYDYVQVADAWDATNTLAGNIGIIERTFGPGKFDMSFRVGKTPTGVAVIQEAISRQQKEEIPELLKLVTRVIYLKVIAEGTALTTGDGKMYWTVPQEFNGYTIINVAAAVYTVSTSGTPTIQIHNLTDIQDILSTRITIDINEKNSYIAAIPPVINTTYDDLVSGDILRIDCDVAGTGTAGLDVMITIQLKG